VCPVDPSTRLWLASPETAIGCLIVGHELASESLGANRAVNVPGLSVTVREMVDALQRNAGPDVTRLIRWERDPRIEVIVGTWPGAWDTSRAQSFGFPADRSFDDVIRAHMAQLAATGESKR
jgi:D-erythronate 2-dehydrogenase